MAEPVAWLALTTEADSTVDFAAPVTNLPEPAWLCAWRTDSGWRRPHRDARRCAPEIIGDGEGPWAVVLTLPDRRQRPIYDDPAVVAATGRALRTSGREVAVLSAFVTDEVHFAGGLCAVPLDVAERWAGWTSLDPWRGLGDRQVLHVGAGVLRASPRPAGPGNQRYTGAPWPHFVWPAA